MTFGDLDDDNYVAGLLEEDARKLATQYNMAGLEAFRSTRASNNPPKPNKRFLANLIRNTDSHNTLLLAREARESQARLRRMSLYGREAGRLSPPLDLTDEGLSSKKRKRPHHGESDRRKQVKGHRSSKDSDSKSHRHGESGRRRHHKDSDEEDSRQSSHRSRHERDERTKHRDHEPRRKSRRDDDTATEGRPRRSHSRSLSRSSSPSSRKHHRSSGHRHRSTSRHRTREPVRPNPTKASIKSSLSRTSNHKSPETDFSDPLDAIVGPQPSRVRVRGRGARTATFMNEEDLDMKHRLASTYDPSTEDTKLASDAEDDWGDALEALKDRQKWKQKGAERLKAAGFSDAIVSNWEKGLKAPANAEKTEEDVRWASKGEGREWDRGKVLDEDGDVRLKPEWGRLT